MIVVKLQGGLGNQMFQYATGKAVAKRNQTSLQLDLDFLLDRSSDNGSHFVFRNYDLDVFRLNASFATQGQEQKYKSQSVLDKIASGFKNKKVYKELFFHYDENALDQKPDLYLDGYWQSPLYFESIEQELRKDFVFAHGIEETSNEVFREIESTDSICVNVRRGDFLTNSFHGVCDMNYFKQAIEFIGDKLSNPHFFVFSDDLRWCEENFKLEFPMTLVGEEHNGFKYSNKLQLMSSCKHFIIPNSTFAWWAVWLCNRNDNIVIAPKKWFADETINTNDLIPQRWLRFDN